MKHDLQIGMIFLNGKEVGTAYISLPTKFF